MCRNIKILFNFDPPVTPEEVRAASLQFVRKISGFNKPSKANEAAFLAAIDEIAPFEPLSHSLETNALPRNREEEAAKAKARAAAKSAIEFAAHPTGCSPRGDSIFMNLGIGAHGAGSIIYAVVSPKEVWHLPVGNQMAVMKQTSHETKGDVCKERWR